MKVIKALIAFVKNRNKEGSSWGAIALALAYFGLSPEQSGEVVNLLIAGAAVLQWLLPDNLIDKVRNLLGKEEDNG